MAFSTLGNFNVLKNKNIQKNVKIVKPVNSIQNWLSISMSQDGTKIILCKSDDLIYHSTNSGNTWNTSNSGNRKWKCVLSSLDGDTWIAAVYGGLIYRSTNQGTSWNSVFSSNETWNCMNISPNGTIMIAGVKTGGSGGTFISTNGGVSWSVLSYYMSRDTLGWNAVAINDDGSKVFACADDGVYFSLGLPGSTPSWNVVSSTLNIPFYTISIFNQGNGLIVGGSSIYMTKDTSNGRYHRHHCP